MRAPKYMQAELSLISPLYFVVHDLSSKICYNELSDDEEGVFYTDVRGRWRVRKWKSIHPINHRLSTWKFNSTNIFKVCQCSEDGGDIGYEPLDMRTAEVVKEGLKNAINAKRFLQSIDKYNDDLVEKATIEEEYIFRHGAKMMWKYNREPMIDLGGKGWRGQVQK